jgi:hypothetical protein
MDSWIVFSQKACKVLINNPRFLTQNDFFCVAAEKIGFLMKNRRGFGRNVCYNFEADFVKLVSILAIAKLSASWDCIFISGITP